MKVTTVMSAMVQPAEATPSRILWNANVDLVIPRIHTASVYFFRSNGSPDFFSGEILRQALARVLVPFYPMAGRLQRDKNGRVEINCNGEGALLVEAEADVCIEDLGNFAPDPKFRNLIPKVDYTQEIGSYPLLVLQITFFRCGGVGLGVGMQHHVADGMAGISFINNWAAMARNEELVSKPFIDRTLLKARNPPSPIFPHIEYKPPPLLIKRPQNGYAYNENSYGHKENGYVQNGNGNALTNGHTNGNRVTNGHYQSKGVLKNGQIVSNGASNGKTSTDAKPNGTVNGKIDSEAKSTLAVGIFKFTKEQVQALKNMAKDEESSVTYSSYEMLSGHIWRCICKARNLVPEQETKLYIATDGRARLNPPLPQGYFGNVIFTCTPMSTVEELTSKPVWFSAKTIKEALKRMDNEYLRSALDYLELEPDLSVLVRGSHTFKSPNLGITSWTRLPIYDADFGWGKPIFMGPAAIAFEGLVYVLPSPTGDGSLTISLGLQADHMPAFAKLITDI